VKNAPFRQYDPWQDYKIPEGKESIRQPYHGLIEFISRIDRGDLLAQARDSAIKEWCNKHGLLGVLLHCCESISQDTVRDGLPWAVSYAREADGWRETPEYGREAPPGALIRGLGQFSPRLQSPKDTWGQFFPSISGVYPCPFSEEFWRTYTEPVEVFVDAARLLNKAVNGLRTLKESRGHIEIKRLDFRQNAGPAIHSLLLPVRSIIELEAKARYHLGYSTGSLLSDLAMMAALDATNYRLLACGNKTCGALLTTKSATAHYCSARCRGTAQMRKYRAEKQRQKVKDHAYRKKIAEEQIAERVQTDAKSVKGGVRK
jgi:hypothetical protein